MKPNSIEQKIQISSLHSLLSNSRESYKKEEKMREKNYRYGSSPKKIKNVLRAAMVVVIALILVGSALLLMGGTKGISDGEINIFDIFAISDHWSSEQINISGSIAGGPPMPLGTPTVNGLFYMDGDQSNYHLLASNPGRGYLYFNLVGTTLYILVRLDNATNDNVFAYKKNDPSPPPNDDDYLTSAHWLPGSGHNANDLIHSDHMNFTLTCGVNSWTWKQDYCYDLDTDFDPSEADWRSDHNGPDAAGWSTPPTGFIQSNSSLEWNLNYYARYAPLGWDVTVGNTRSWASSDWKSVDANGDCDVTDEGYPTYKPSPYDWEWAMVYEFSVDISGCGTNPIYVKVESAHNSPVKDGLDDDVPIPDDGLVEIPEFSTLLIPLLGTIFLFFLMRRKYKK